MTAGTVWQMTINHTVLDHYSNDVRQALPLMMNAALPRAVAIARVLLDERDREPEYIQAVTDMVAALARTEDRSIVERLVSGELVTS